MIAKYDGSCPRCKKLISKGERIGYSEKTGAMHPTCFEEEIREHGSDDGIESWMFTDADPVFRIGRGAVKDQGPREGALL